ncbi:MAG: RES family NAD+ phosphorylase [Gammaproteobacteria bacterium]
MHYQITEDSRGDWYRNIVSLRKSADLFADLVEDPAHAAILAEHELATKLASAPQPIIARPFEDAELYDPIAQAIAWPFEHPAASRYSTGRYGVWYGAGTMETSVHETVYHFRKNTLASEAARETAKPIVQERRVHLVHCSAALVDLRPLVQADKRLVDPDDYTYCQSLGAELRAAFQPGVLTKSARHRNGDVIAVFVREALSNPRDVCYLTYILDPRTGRVRVERTPGRTWMVLDVS